MKKNNYLSLNLQFFAEEKQETSSEESEEIKAKEEGSEETGASIDKPIVEEEPKEQPAPTIEELQAKIAELTAANASLHKTVNKASTDAADWKKKYQSKLTVDEQKVQAEKEKEDYLKSIEKELTVLKSTIALQSGGFAEDEAKAISEARYVGDIETAINLENKHYENLRKQLEDDYKKKVVALSQPASGSSTVDYGKQFATAMNLGDKQGAVKALLKQAGMTQV
jgi:membrane-bound lytic murein transglycosylase